MKHDEGQERLARRITTLRQRTDYARTLNEYVRAVLSVLITLLLGLGAAGKIAEQLVQQLLK